MIEVQTGKNAGWKILFLVLILGVFPAMSWVYLSGGLQWRKDAVSELNHNFGAIRQAWVVFQDGHKEDLLDGKVCVIHNFGVNPDLTDGNKKMLDQGEELYKQFGRIKNETSIRDEFRMVSIAEKGTATFVSHSQTLPSADMATWVFTGGVNTWKQILDNSYEKYCLAEREKPVEYYWAVTDTSGTIRRFYDALDPKQMERMVQHIAILLPAK